HAGAEMGAGKSVSRLLLNHCSPTSLRSQAMTDNSLLKAFLYESSILDAGGRGTRSLTFLFPWPRLLPRDHTLCGAKPRRREGNLVYPPWLGLDHQAEPVGCVIARYV